MCSMNGTTPLTLKRTVRVYSQPMVSEVCTAELLLAEKNCAALLTNRMRNHAFIPTLGFEIYHSTLLSAIFGGRYSCKPDCNNVHWFWREMHVLCLDLVIPVCAHNKNFSDQLVRYPADTAASYRSPPLGSFVKHPKRW